jgi:hypothetical protein
VAETGLHGKAPLRRRRTTDSSHDFPHYPNLVELLRVTRPDHVWVTDITYVKLRGEFVYWVQPGECSARLAQAPLTGRVDS